MFTAAPHGRADAYPGAGYDGSVDDPIDRRADGLADPLIDTNPDPADDA